MAKSVTGTLRRALRLIAEQRAEAHAEMARCLDGLSLSLSVGAEPTLTLRGEGERLVEVPPEGRAAVRIATSRAAIRSLIAGGLTLRDALRSGAVEVGGATPHLGRAFGAFEYFVGALLRMEEAEGLRLELESDQ